MLSRADSALVSLRPTPPCIIIINNGCEADFAKSGPTRLPARLCPLWTSAAIRGRGTQAALFGVEGQRQREVCPPSPRLGGDSQLTVFLCNSWWVKKALPPIAYASPSVQISVEPTPTPSASAAPLPTPAPATQPWLVQPGVFIQFSESACRTFRHSSCSADSLRADDPSLPEAFFPLTQARSDVLIKRFWDTVEDPAALEKLRQTPATTASGAGEEGRPAGEGLDLAAPEGAVGKDLLL